MRRDQSGKKTVTEKIGEGGGRVQRANPPAGRTPRSKPHPLLHTPRASAALLSFHPAASFLPPISPLHASNNQHPRLGTTHAHMAGMAFRRAIRNGGTSTARSALASSSRATRSTRASQAAMLHNRSSAPASGPRLAVAATPQAARAPAASRGMASAMPAEDRDSAESASAKNTRFFQPVEKLANGVAVIRCVCLLRRSSTGGRGANVLLGVFSGGRTCRSAARIRCFSAKNVELALCRFFGEVSLSPSFPSLHVTCNHRAHHCCPLRYHYSHSCCALQYFSGAGTSDSPFFAVTIPSVSACSCPLSVYVWRCNKGRGSGRGWACVFWLCSICWKDSKIEWEVH